MTGHAMEKSFEVTRKGRDCWPDAAAGVASLVRLVISGGISAQKSETDPSKLRVPRGPLPLDHDTYGKHNRPSGTAPTSVLTAPTDPKPGVNALTAESLQPTPLAYDQALSIEVDGSEVVENSKGIADHSRGVADHTVRYGGGRTSESEADPSKLRVPRAPFTSGS